MTWGMRIFHSLIFFPQVNLASLRAKHAKNMLHMHRRSHCEPHSATSQSVSQLGSQPVSYPSMQPLGATKITTTTRTLATALDFYRPEVARHIKALPLLSGEMLHLKWREKWRKRDREREGERGRERCAEQTQRKSFLRHEHYNAQ